MGVAFLIGGWGIFNLGVWLVTVFHFGKLAAMVQEAPHNNDKSAAKAEFLLQD